MDWAMAESATILSSSQRDKNQKLKRKRKTTASDLASILDCGQ
jgi:hypothetical protein